MSRNQIASSSKGKQPLVTERSFASSAAEGSFYYAASPPAWAQSQPTLYVRFDLYKYITECGLPAFNKAGVADLLALRDMKRAIAWPQFSELKRAPGVRVLQQIVSAGDPAVIAACVKKYMLQFKTSEQQPPVEGEEMPSLRLPCHGMTTFEDRDEAFFTGMRNEDDMVMLYKHYLLDSVTEAVRIMSRLPRHAPITDTLRLRITNRLCPAHHGKWDIFVLGKDAFNEVPMVVVFVPPWEFGSEDIDQFAAGQFFGPNDLATLDTKEHKASDIMWAVLHDICKGRGYKFVFTNYHRWVFGTFDEGWTRASVTEPYDANLVDLTGASIAAPYKGCNVIEILTYWFQVARGFQSD
ncbi:hypothetical protein B0H34DRAFT_799473 [Crassisporium funariophilum]|nr:hypothetical protein B0H34DRAFT_799473 [Crassisporium funariophilum]